MLRCVSLIAIFSLSLVVDRGNGLECYFCIPGPRNLCTNNPGILQECNEENSENWLDLLPKPESLSKTSQTKKGQGSKLQCFQMRGTDGYKVAYVRGCLAKNHPLCDYFRDRLEDSGVSIQCKYCKKNGCNGSVKIIKNGMSLKNGQSNSFVFDNLFSENGGKK